MLKELLERSGNVCELCSSDNDLRPYVVPPKNEGSINHAIVICTHCESQLSSDTPDANHWRCLNDSMWSEVPAVKVVAYRVLHQIQSEGWPRELLDMMYIEDEDLKWAKETIVSEEDQLVHRDSNGAVLNAGDSVVAIKDLNVKGSSMVVKRGTAIRNIGLVHDNAGQIEGKVDGQRIVILTKYVKK